MKCEGTTEIDADKTTTELGAPYQLKGILDMYRAQNPRYYLHYFRLYVNYYFFFKSVLTLEQDSDEISKNKSKNTKEPQDSDRAS